MRSYTDAKVFFIFQCSRFFISSLSLTYFVIHQKKVASAFCKKLNHIEIYRSVFSGISWLNFLPNQMNMSLIEEKCSQVVMLAEQRQRRRYRVSCESSLLIKLDHSWVLRKVFKWKKIKSVFKVMKLVETFFVRDYFLFLLNLLLIFYWFIALNKIIYYSYKI